MAQAQAFETDFWKDANLRKVWDDIVPGEPRETLPYVLTKEAIQLYCRSVGEDHPLYFDETYAKTTPYGGLIAPPSIHILLMFSCTPADDWMRSPGTVNAGQSWSYNKPARPGDTITLQARALDKFIKRERLFVVHDTTSQILDESRKKRLSVANVAPIVLSAIETRMKLSSVKAQPKTCGLCLAYQELAFP